MIQLRFKKTQELFDFIEFVPDFKMWNILECKLITNDGTLNDYNIDIHRNVRDGSEIICLNDDNLKDKFDKVVNDVKKNIYRGIKFDLLLQVPIEMTNNFDEFGGFNDFFVCLYTNDETIICSTHFSEVNKNHGIKPIQSFDKYIIQLYNDWTESKIKQS